MIYFTAIVGSCYVFLGKRSVEMFVIVLSGELLARW